MTEKFEKVTRDDRPNEMFASITASGNITFNVDIQNKLYDNEDYVELFVSGQDNEIAVKFNNESGMKVGEGGSTLSAYAQSLLDELDINESDIESAIRMPYTGTENGLIVFDASPVVNEVFDVCFCGKKYKQTPAYQEHIASCEEAGFDE
jgi:hypothetical protein